jgi:hypothetical protein
MVQRKIFREQRYKKECAGIAPAHSASPKLLQEGLAGRKVIAGNI